MKIKSIVQLIIYYIKEVLNRISNFFSDHEFVVMSCYIIIGLICNYVNSFKYKFHLFSLKEDMVSTIFPVVAQIIASLIGLIIAAYGLIEFKKGEKEDDDVYKEVRNRLFTSFQRITIIGVIDVLVSLLVIPVYNLTSL